VPPSPTTTSGRGCAARCAAPRTSTSTTRSRATAPNNVVEALTVAYNLLVGGLLVPILGGLLWKRGTVHGALASVVVGGLAVIGLMAAYGILANQPVYYGLLLSLAAYVIVSLATPATDAAVLATWRERLAGRDAEPLSEPVPVHQ
jgi:SSS family solute:Na+ symporter